MKPFGDAVVNFIQNDTVNGRAINRVTTSRILYTGRLAGGLDTNEDLPDGPN
jgi:hypothetical protein